MGIGEPLGSQGTGLLCWQGGARTQQASAEALPLFPGLVGLAAGIIIFSQMFRVLLSCQKTTNPSLRPELLSPEVAPFALQAMREGSGDVATTVPTLHCHHQQHRC